MMDRSKAKLRKKYEEEMVLSVVEEKKKSLELLGVSLA